MKRSSRRSVLTSNRTKGLEPPSLSRSMSAAGFLGIWLSEISS